MGGANYELSQPFLVEVLFGLRASSVEILSLAVLVLLRTVLESIMDSGDLVSVADLTVIDNQTCETLQLIVDYKLASGSVKDYVAPQGSQLPSQVP